jgi:L-amino acid N-acyltransferase YncA
VHHDAAPAGGYGGEVSIRDAADGDWEQIWPFFDQIVQEGRTYAYPLDLTPEQARDLWMERPPGRTTVWVDGGRVLGSAKMGPNRPSRGSHIATASFMVDPAARTRGIGRALAEDMVAWARSTGYHGIQFNAVVAANVGAVRLWQSLGFEVVGTVPDAFDHADDGFVGLHVMYLAL